MARRRRRTVSPSAVPAQPQGGQRAALAAAFTAAARSAERSWVTPENGGPTGFADFEAAVDASTPEYGGAPFRTNGLTTRDQAVTMLVNHANSARLLLQDADSAGRGRRCPTTRA